MESNAYSGWAIVELMGHRRMGGLVSEAVQYGATMLRLDVPGDDGTTEATQFYGGAAIYCITPCAEDVARALAKNAKPAPVQRWELPALAAPKPTLRDGDDDGGGDEGEADHNPEGYDER